MNPTTPITSPAVTHTTTPDCEPSQFILPDLLNDCKFPLRKNPHRHAASRASEKWLTEVGELAEPEFRGYRDMDAAAFVSLIYPDADACRLQLCVESVNFAFIMDDLMESGGVDARKAHEWCIPVLRDPINFEAEHRPARMCKSFSNRFRETAGPGCRERYIRGKELYFAAVAKQLEDRAKGNTYDLESYIIQRRGIVGMQPYFALIEFATGIDLPDEVVSHPAYEGLDCAATDHVAWVNDILSYNKEQASGGAPWENLVAVLMHVQGLDLQSAMDYAGQMCKDALQRFESNCAILPSWGEEVDRQVAIYIEGLQQWMIGSLHWHFDSVRYVGNDGGAVKRDRIVKLLPKMPL
ncbi:isoprenoid synthase domain-containing protein [Suillus subaureus]|uniref:Terpene synthase n=1 Tax=Suillus subaureus TaxID=48587 RepID=A0A9P7EGY6_9AGAM|nr:isoprenoid synthase domain-containing protein [Suillus subaureus]KAG1820891.1 isoprenoid synthase domain-containing protein [Suillus subaureus]